MFLNCFRFAPKIYDTLSGLDNNYSLNGVGRVAWLHKQPGEWPLQPLQVLRQVFILRLGIDALRVLRARPAVRMLRVLELLRKGGHPQELNLHHRLVVGVRPDHRHFAHHPLADLQQTGEDCSVQRRPKFRNPAEWERIRAAILRFIPARSLVDQE